MLTYSVTGVQVDPRGTGCRSMKHPAGDLADPCEQGELGKQEEGTYAAGGGWKAGSRDKA